MKEAALFKEGWVGLATVHIGNDWSLVYNNRVGMGWEAKIEFEQLSSR